MDELITWHRQALDATEGIVAGIRDDQWNAPTPCEGWDVRFVANHVVSGNWWAAELTAGKTIAEVGHRLDGDILGADAAAAYRKSADAAHDAFAAPGALEAPCAVSYGPVPGSVYLGHRFIDVLIHGWDLATATDQDAVLDPVLAEACWQVLEPQIELFREAGAFAAAADIPAGADAQTRLLLAVGRTP